MTYLLDFKVVLVMMMYAITISEQGESTEYGRRFVFTFLENLCEETLKLTITAFADAEIQIHVLTNVDTLFVPGGNSETILFPTTLLPDRSILIGQRAVHVTSTTEVALYAFNFCVYSSASFNVLPVSQLGAEYYIASTGFIHDSTPPNVPTFSVIAVGSNTTISINFRIRNSGTCGPSGEFTDGQEFSVELNEFDDLTIYCTGDPTGTFISSSLPVAAIAGHVGSKVPESVTGRDAMAEMMLPVGMYGKRYILHGPGPGRGAVFRILTSVVDTGLVTSEDTVYNLDPSDFIELDLSAGEALCLRSSEPIMVVMYGKGGKVCPNDRGDPFMATLTPVERFGTTFASDLPSLISDTFDSSVSVVMKSHFANDLDGEFTVQEIPSCLYSVATRDVFNGNMNYPVPNNATISMIVYMNARFEGNAFVLTSPAVRHRRWSECDINPCINEGNCSADLFTYLCTCPTDYSGIHCEEKLTTTSISTNSALSPVQSSPYHSIASSPEVTVHSFLIKSVSTGTETTSIYKISESINTMSVFAATFQQMLFNSQSEATFQPTPLLPRTDVNPSETDISHISSPSNMKVMYGSTLFESASIVRVESTTLYNDAEATPSIGEGTEVPTTETEVTPSETEVTFGSTSTILYATVPPQLTVSSKYTHWSCPCKCPATYTKEDIPQVANQLTEDIRDNLIVDPKELSQQIRKKTSAPDDRPSARQLGGAAIAILVVMSVVFIVTDFVKILNDIVYGLRSQKRW